MIDRKKYYIAACRFAIHQIIKTGSSYFTISDGNEVLSIPWNNVLLWLDEKNKRGITEVIETPTKVVRKRLEDNMSNNMTSQQAHKILNEYISLDSDLDNEFINALRVADKALLACGEIVDKFAKD